MLFYIGAFLFVFFFPFILPFLALFIEIKDILITTAIVSALLIWAAIVLIRDGYGSKHKWKNYAAVIFFLIIFIVSAYLAATVEEQQIIDLIRKIPYVQKLMGAK